MRTTVVCLILLLTHMQAAEPNAEAWLAQTKMAPPLKVSASLEAWQQQRGEIRAKLNELLADLPPRPPVSAFQVIAKEDKGAYTLEKIQFDNSAGEIVKGFLFIPKTATAQTQAPAILYCHWHGGQYDIGKTSCWARTRRRWHPVRRWRRPVTSCLASTRHVLASATAKVPTDRSRKAARVR